MSKQVENHWETGWTYFPYIYDHVDDCTGLLYNTTLQEIEKIEKIFGLSPQGGYDTVAARLNAIAGESHEQNTDQYLDHGGASEVSVADVKDAVDKKHSQNTDTALGTQSGNLDMGDHYIENVSEVRSSNPSGEFQIKSDTDISFEPQTADPCHLFDIKSVAAGVKLLAQRKGVGDTGLEFQDDHTQITLLAITDAINTVVPKTGGQFEGHVGFNYYRVEYAYLHSMGELNFKNESVKVEGIKDEDTLSSDSDKHLATQQSIKAYVDSQNKVYPVCARLNAIQTLVSGTWTWINVRDDNVRGFDPDGCFSNSTYRYTCPVDGIYSISVLMSPVNLDSGKFCAVYVWKNDASSPLNVCNANYTYSAIANGYPNQAYTTIVQLSAGDTLRMKGYHNNGTDLNMEGTTTMMCVHLVQRT